MLGFSHPLPSTVSSGTDVRISLHAVNQRSDWLATQAVECHIEKSPLRCDLSSKFFDHLFYYYY